MKHIKNCRVKKRKQKIIETLAISSISLTSPIGLSTYFSNRSLDRVVVDLRQDIFDHGQLYVALSRIRKGTDLASVLEWRGGIVSWNGVVDIGS